MRSFSRRGAATAMEFALYCDAVSSLVVIEFDNKSFVSQFRAGYEARVRKRK